jgi:tRNA nucleotidyltransferase/poly(A) polymerase
MQLSEKLFIDIEVSDAVDKLHRIFAENGAKLYGVGGFVRDKVKSIIDGSPFKPKDFDLVTALKPDDVIKLLRRSKLDLSIREVGKSFGVVLVTIDNDDYEIATFREDAATGDGRRPDYVVFSTIDKDAARRDLTINALYYDFDEKSVLDFHGGIQDLHSRRIRFVGDAQARIYEDKLRVMRFVRFHCRVNSGGPDSVDKDTRKVIQQCQLRPEISDERIRDEFVKGLTSCLDKVKFLQILEDLGLLAQVFPYLKTTVDLRNGFLSLGGLVAQILRYNEQKMPIRDKLIGLKWTREEAADVEFLTGLPRWEPSLVVDFKKCRAKTHLQDQEVLEYTNTFRDECSPGHYDLIKALLEYPYPSVSSEAVMSEGFTGSALGQELRRREVESFRGVFHDER